MTRLQLATADCGRKSRMHPPRTALRATDGDYRVARYAIVRRLHQVAAMLRCRLLQRCELPCAHPPPPSQKFRPPWLWVSPRRDQESDESKFVALHAPDNWRG